MGSTKYKSAKSETKNIILIKIATLFGYSGFNKNKINGSVINMATKNDPASVVETTIGIGLINSPIMPVEIKIGKDRLSDEQEGFMRNVQNAGGFAFVASDFEQFKEGWVKVVKEL